MPMGANPRTNSLIPIADTKLVLAPVTSAASTIAVTKIGSDITKTAVAITTVITELAFMITNLYLYLIFTESIHLFTPRQQQHARYQNGSNAHDISHAVNGGSQ